MPAIAIAGIAAAGSIASGAMGASAAGHAADTQAAASLEATRESNAQLQQQYNTTRADQLPYLTGGAGALGRLDYLLGLPGNQTSTKGAYSAGYGPQGSAYIPSNGGGPVVGYGAPASAPATNPGDPRSGVVGTFQGRNSQLNPYGDGRGNYPMDDRGSMVTKGGYKGGINPNAAAATPVSYTADPQFGSLMHDFSAQDFQTDPGYAFRLAEGQKALDRSAAARGGLFSGDTLKANDRYNQGFASNEYQNAYNRYQNNRTTKYNFLSNAAGGGQVAANNLASSGDYLSNAMANNTFNGITGAGNARASGYIGAANAWGGAINGVGNAAIYGIANRPGQRV